MSSALGLEAQPGAIEKGPYLLRPLISEVPLSADGDSKDIRITCVEVLGECSSGTILREANCRADENLYIGTSAAEILHFVQIPPDPSDAAGQPTYIYASRLQPPVTQQAEDGVQQILLLPTVNKACILCNNTLSFYQLPELSPAFPRLKPLGCVWVGGLDQNDAFTSPSEDGVVIMLCLKTRIRLVRIADNLPNPLKIRDIELGGCLAASRRGDVACVSDSQMYSLLDVIHQQRIPLFPISSQEELSPKLPSPPPDLSRPASRSISGAIDVRPSAIASHGRSSSLGVFGASPERPPRDSSRPLSTALTGRYGFDAPESLSRLQSPQPGVSPERSLQVPGQSQARRGSTDKALPPPPEEPPQTSPPASIRPAHSLRPHVASPSPSEFLLTTGTSLLEPGVGMFVNLDGDVVRGTIEFSSYPSALVVDGKGIDLSASTASGEASEEGHVLAVVQKRRGEGRDVGLEVQRWDTDPSDGGSQKTFIPMKSIESTDAESEQAIDLGIRSLGQSTNLNLSQVGECLAQKHLSLKKSKSGEQGSVPEVVAKREKEEMEFAKRLGEASTRLIVWHNNEVQWLVRNPFVLQLDARLEVAVQQYRNTEDRAVFPDRLAVESVINDLRGLDSSTELEFVGFSYIKQKAAFILFIHTLVEALDQELDQRAVQATQEALLDCDLDPRIILSFIPVIRKEVIQSPEGLWVYGGLKSLVDLTFQRMGITGNADSKFDFSEESPPGILDTLQLMRSYMQHWRSKKGLASVAGGNELFTTIDAAILHILLILDKDHPKGPASAGSIRADLNAVVDSDVDCFEHAVKLLEQYKRLYVLSRLYQRRRLYSRVLETWKRIISGEEDAGGEFTEGEQELRRYLSKLRDPALVKEYGTWLAARNPRLGVQVFADDHSRVTFTPSEALQILREGAPDAVREYLEFLVFGKKQTQHANELISYYLTMVLDELASSPSSRQILLQTYETYRALAPPKPTYRDFITDNAIPDEWWHSRLRLLQLLGGTLQSRPSTVSPDVKPYDSAAIMQRLQPYEAELVPEMIILYGQQQRHEEAVRLLAHGLADFDTAIRYCLLGGSSLFPSDSVGETIARPAREEQARLFRFLLREMLALEDEAARVERTGELLERFGGWFDVGEVLDLIPNDWEVGVVAGFIVQHLRRLVHERAETAVARALSGAVNLKTSVELVERGEEMGPIIEGVT